MSRFMLITPYELTLIASTDVNRHKIERPMQKSLIVLALDWL